MPPDVMPHLDTDDDVRSESTSAADRLRAAAVREEMKPLLEHTDQARRLLQQLSGFIASKSLDVPIEIDQQLAAWLHADARQRKERQS